MNPNEMTYEIPKVIHPKDIYKADTKFDYDGWTCVGFWPPKDGEYYKVCKFNYPPDTPMRHSAAAFEFKACEPRLIYVQDYSDSDIVDFVCSLQFQIHKLVGCTMRSDIKKVMQREGWKSGE